MASRMCSTGGRPARARSLEDLLDRLDERGRSVIRWRFGLAGGPALTLREVAERLEISHERVRQIQGEDLARLQKLSAEVGWDGDQAEVERAG